MPDGLRCPARTRFPTAHPGVAGNDCHPVRRHGIHAAARLDFSKQPIVLRRDGSRACARDDGGSIVLLSLAGLAQLNDFYHKTYREGVIASAAKQSRKP